MIYQVSVLRCEKQKFRGINHMVSSKVSKLGRGGFRIQTHVFCVSGQCLCFSFQLFSGTWWAFPLLHMYKRQGRTKTQWWGVGGWPGGGISPWSMVVLCLECKCGGETPSPCLCVWRGFWVTTTSTTSIRILIICVPSGHSLKILPSNSSPGSRF